MLSATRKVTTTNREKRAFWQYVLAMGLTLLVIPLFWDVDFVTMEYAVGVPLTLAALLRLWSLKAQRRAVTRGH
jgi:uncharacterized membrane protein YqjE